MFPFVAPRLAALGWLVLGGATCLRADAIANGTFENGYFRSWNVNNQSYGSGSFLVATGTAAPISGLPSVGPASGNFYAISDQTGPATNALSFVFTIPASAPSVILTFDMFVNDWSGVGPIVNPAGLNYTAFPNQHARVDLLTEDAPAFSVTQGLLKNLYLGVDSGPSPHTYTHYEVDITSVVAGGGNFRLRFAQVDNVFFLNVGVDNVHIYTGREGGAPPPEPPPFTDTTNPTTTNQSSSGALGR